MLQHSDSDPYRLFVLLFKCEAQQSSIKKMASILEYSYFF